jgi:branched-chain amino acid transport system substrate-binding protein
MIFRRFAAVTALVCAVALVAGPAPSPAQTDQTITFGAALSLTGRFSREGRLTQQGYDIWADYVNAHGGFKVGGKTYKVAIKYYDDETNEQTAARLVEKLIAEDHVNFILGPYGSAASFATAAVVDRHKIPMVEANGPAAAIFNQGYRYIFAVLAPAYRYLEGVLTMAEDLKPKPQTVAITNANDIFSVEVAQGAADFAKAHGFTVVYNNKYPTSITDFSPIITQVKAANPDIFLNAGRLEESLLATKGFKEQNFSPKLAAYSVGPDTPDFRQALGKDANYVFGAAQWSTVVKYQGIPGFYRTAPEYAKAFLAKYGQLPEYHNAESTAACLAFEYAMQKAGSLDTEKVRDALASLDVVTFYGELKFDNRGLNIYKPMVVNQIQNGELVTVWPPGVANAKPQYPTPPWTTR